MLLSIQPCMETPLDLGERTHEELPRVLTATNALAIVVGIIIGSGIFLVPREMMAAVGSSRMVYAVWITGGLLSLFGAMSYAEVAAMRPRVGGEYAFLHDAYGPLTAFLYTWTWTMIAKPASIATIAAGLMRVLGTFPVFAFLDRAAVGHLMWSQVMAIAATWLITGLNIVSTRDSAKVQTLLTWLKVVMIVVIAGLLFREREVWRLAQLQLGVSRRARRLCRLYDRADCGALGLRWLVGRVADGRRSAEAAAVLAGGAGRRRDHRRRAVHADQRGHSVRVALGRDCDDGPPGYRCAAASGGKSWRGAGGCRAWPSASARRSWAARFRVRAFRSPRLATGCFRRVLGQIHPRFQTPWVSLLLQAVLSSLLLLAIGKFQALFSLAIFSEWFFYALTAATVFVFRVREPDANRPYRVTGYPVVPALFILAALVLLVFSFANQPRESIAGALVILCGVPVHYLFQRSKPAGEKASDYVQ